MRVTVVIRQDQSDRVEDIAAQLRSAGMQVERVLATLGMITGSVAEGQRSTLEHIEGVGSVSEERTVQIAPPDAEIQ